MHKYWSSISGRFVVVAGVSILVAGAIVIIRSVLDDPLSRELRTQVQAVNVEKPKNPDVSMDFVTDQARLTNQMMRRPSTEWSTEDTAWLVGLLDREPVDPPVWSDVDQKDDAARIAARRALEHYMVHLSAMLVVPTHLKLDGPLPEEVVGAFEARAIADLGHWHENYRRAAIACIKEAGWLDRPDIRPLIEDIRDNDDDESIRNQARRFLLFADGMPVEDLEDDCPTCPDKAGLTGGG